MKMFWLKYFILISALSINFELSLNAQMTDTAYIRARWNMVSLPLKIQDAHYLTIFPGAISQPYKYESGFPDETLRVGKSYFIKFPSDTTYLITGEPIQSVIKEVAAGWNMIGSISEPIPLSHVQSDPPGIVVSDFFEYNAAPGYDEAETIIPGSGYWVKVNQAGNLIFTSMGYPCPSIHTVEYEGKTYSTVQIGNQCWLRENLNVGTMILGSDTSKDNGIIEKYCYDDDTSNCNIYGGLYQWNEATQYTYVVQGVCPSGWHIPTLVEFQTCSTAVGGDGNALKTIGQGMGDGAGTNTSGFSILLAGCRNEFGLFINLGYDANIWSSTGQWPYHALLYSSSGFIVNYRDNPLNGFSVRCLKDIYPNVAPYPPSYPYPTDNYMGIFTSVPLGWSCKDPESDTLVYDVYFGIDNPPVIKVDSNETQHWLMRTGLSDTTTYYWRVVAKDNYGHSTIGPVWRFTTGGPYGLPCPDIPTVEYSGKTYNTIQIDNQCWLKENLDVGTMIQGSDTSKDNGVVEKYCYNDSIENCNTYGGLYQWDEAMQYLTGEGSQGICPDGWHIPKANEWPKVGGDGNALKAIGQGSGSGVGTNTSGFSALLAGYRPANGYFYYLSWNANFWTSREEYYPNHAYYLTLSFNHSNVYLSSAHRDFGFSIRCIKD